MSQQLLAQVWGLLVIFVWASLLSGAIWGFCVLSELTRALEAKYLEEAVGMVCQMVTVDATNSQVVAMEPNDQIIEQWKQVLRRSPLTRRIATKHGLNGIGFTGVTPKGLWSMRQDLQQARGEKAETALELADRHFLLCVAGCLYACPLTREIAFLRLRISPAAEISGLGAASAEGGRLFSVFKDAVTLLVEARHDEQRFHSPLRREVRELSMTVQSQEVLLEALMRSQKRRRTWQQRKTPLGSLPEQVEPTDSGQSSVAGDAAGRAARAVHPAVPPSHRPPSEPGTSLPDESTDELTPSGPQSQPVSVEAMTEAFAGAVPLSFSSHSGSDRTMSDRGAGNVTPRSNSAETPSPSVIGRSMLTRPRTSGRQADQALAAQLAGVLQTHQQLLAALQHLSGASASSSAGPAPDSSGTGSRGAAGFQQAVQSLTRQLEQRGQGSGPQQPLASMVGSQPNLGGPTLV